jgi:hypothetical protein
VEKFYFKLKKHKVSNEEIKNNIKIKKNIKKKK